MADLIDCEVQQQFTGAKPRRARNVGRVGDLNVRFGWKVDIGPKLGEELGCFFLAVVRQPGFGAEVGPFSAFSPVVEKTEVPCYAVLFLSRAASLSISSSTSATDRLARSLLDLENIVKELGVTMTRQAGG